MEVREEGDDVQSDDLLQRWLAALRSGKYRQAREALKTYDSYCCLGVLCDLADPAGWGALEDGWAGTPANLVSEGNELPPIELIERVGLQAPDMHSLIGLNDDEREPFSAIADAIEQMVRAHKVAKAGDA